MGFEKFVLLSHTSDTRSALLALPRLYKVYAKIKGCCEGERGVLVNINVEVDDEPSDYYI